MDIQKNNPDREMRDLYERYAPLVHRRCRYILGSEDEAWDATQDVFMKLMAFLPTIENRSSIYSWLLSTSTNLCISTLRRKRGELFDEEVHGDSSGLSAEKRVILREIITKVLRPWDKKVRDILIYSYIDEYTQTEIAELTGLGESTIRKYLTRFKRTARSDFPNAKEVFHA